jgi:tmRNA-binding protein
LLDKPKADYFIEDRYEVGLVPQRLEVPSGRRSCADKVSHVVNCKMARFIDRCHISPLNPASTHVTPAGASTRTRKPG